MAVPSARNVLDGFEDQRKQVLAPFLYPAQRLTDMETSPGDTSKDSLQEKEIIPSIKPAEDEVASYRRSSRSEAPKQSNFNGLLVFVIVLMAIVMGIGGYTLYEVQKKLDQSNELLAQGQENIRELDSRLAATGTDVSKTLQDIKAQISTNFSEIDKLWSVAYRQNKPDIQKNVRAIKALENDLGVKITRMDTSVQKMSGQYQSMLDELSALREGLLQDNEELITQIALLRGQVQDQAVIQEASTRNLNILGEAGVASQEVVFTFVPTGDAPANRLGDFQVVSPASEVPESKYA